MLELHAEHTSFRQQRQWWRLPTEADSKPKGQKKKKKGRVPKTKRPETGNNGEGGRGKGEGQGEVRGVTTAAVGRAVVLSRVSRCEAPCPPHTHAAEVHMVHSTQPSPACLLYLVGFSNCITFVERTNHAADLGPCFIYIYISYLQAELARAGWLLRMKSRQRPFGRPVLRWQD